MKIGSRTLGWSCLLLGASACASHVAPAEPPGPPTQKSAARSESKPASQKATQSSVTRPDRQRADERAEPQRADTERASTGRAKQQTGSVPPGATKHQDERGAWWLPIPSGSYQMGSKDDPEGVEPHPVTVLSFWIRESEVTRAEYQACVDAKVCTPPSEVDDCKPQPAMRPDMPVACIDFGQAEAYCRYENARLPSEEEWEFAARGTDGRLYPWGPEPPKKSTLVWRRWFGPAVINSTEDVSFFSVHDMAGNVAEWTSSPWQESGAARSARDLRTVRGGSWDLTEKEAVTATYRYDSLPSYQGPDVGVRCVR